MQWADAIKRPSPRTLRQFAGLWLVFWAGLAALRVWRGQSDGVAWFLAVLAVVIGGLGLVQPRLVRYIYTGWMVAAFPIGWTVSRVMLGALFFLVFTPIGLVFRLTGRDSLRLKHGAGGSYWIKRGPAPDPAEYLRQS